METKNQVEKVFKVFYICGVFLAITSVLASVLIFGAAGPFYYGAIPLFSCLLFLKIYFVMSFCCLKDSEASDKKSFLGLPFILFVYYLSVIGALLGLLYIGNIVEGASYGNLFNNFIFSGFLSIIAGLATWFTSLKKIFYLTDYEREIFKKEITLQEA